MSRATKIITLLNNKGGILKTTIAFNLAKNYIRNEREVMVVDYDQQQNIASLLPDHIVDEVTVGEYREMGKDYVIVDTGPYVQTEHIELMLESDIVITPVGVEGLDVERTVSFLKVVQAINCLDKVRLVIIYQKATDTMYKILKPTIEAIAEEYGVEIIAEIQKRANVSQALSYKQSVFEYKTHKDTRLQYRHLFSQIGKAISAQNKVGSDVETA
jgi:chromosome partitioning protein